MILFIYLVHNRITMLRTHYTDAITEKNDGKSVKVAGWVSKIRDLGKVKFIILRDKGGEIQITLKKGETKEEILDDAKSLSREDVIVVTGKVSKNTSAIRGREIIPDKLEIVATSAVPLPMETDPKIKSELDTRLDNRFLDLRRPEVNAIFRIKDIVQRSFVEYFEKHGFVLVNTPVIVAAATEGGANLFPISYFEREAFLGQSPQLYKQMMMASSIDRVVIVTPAFRAEEHDTTRHLNEVMQMDIEVGFVEDEEDALKFLEEVIHYIYSQVSAKCKDQLAALDRRLTIPSVPFKRITYDESLEILAKEGIKVKWGEDIPPDGERALCRHSNPVIVKKWPTDVRAFYSMPEPGNEKICRAYDLLMDGVELCSGAQRIHDYDKLVKELKRRGMNPDNFGFYLDAFKYGMPPHAGWSIGLERITAAICGLKNIREAVIWPRDRKRLEP